MKAWPPSTVCTICPAFSLRRLLVSQTRASTVARRVLPSTTWPLASPPRALFSASILADPDDQAARRRIDRRQRPFDVGAVPRRNPQEKLVVHAGQRAARFDQR